MATEFEKMRSEELYDFTDPQVDSSLKHAKDLCRRMQTMTPYDEGFRALVEELIPGIPASANITPPFWCDHGNGIRMGEGTFLNFGCTILDGAFVTIGNHTLLGPNCQLYTPQHPKDHVLRRQTKETAHPITIGEDCWLGGNVTVCPGVTIGDRVIVAAGSVVVHDVPSDVMLAGNPAVIKRHLK